METSGKFKNDKKKKCSCPNSNGDSNEGWYQKKSGSKCKESSTVDGKKLIIKTIKSLLQTA